MSYVERVYGPSSAVKRELVKTLRRKKINMKREIAKTREQKKEIVEISNIVCKVEEEQISSIVYDKDSEETKKKKKNRMSAQNSRDRKKEYIKEI